jgi:hypothetical protein
LRTSPIDKSALAKIKLFERSRRNGSRRSRTAPMGRQARNIRLAKARLLRRRSPGAFPALSPCVRRAHSRLSLAPCAPAKRATLSLHAAFVRRLSHPPRPA